MARNMPDPTTASKRWSSQMGASTQKMTDGINSVTVAPGQAAANAADLWANNVAAAKGRFKTNVGAVSLSAWQTAAITKGVGRVAQGAQAAEGKYAAAAQVWYPKIASIVAGLPPRGTIQQNMQRAVQFGTNLNAAKTR
jgi:hypothetical protein